MELFDFVVFDFEDFDELLFDAGSDLLETLAVFLPDFDLVDFVFAAVLFDFFSDFGFEDFEELLLDLVSEVLEALAVFFPDFDLAGFFLAVLLFEFERLLALAVFDDDFEDFLAVLALPPFLRQ